MAGSLSMPIGWVYKRRDSERSQSVSSAVEQLIEALAATGKPHQRCLWKPDPRKEAAKTDRQTEKERQREVVAVRERKPLKYMQTDRDFSFKKGTCYTKYSQRTQQSSLTMSREQRNHMDECYSHPALFQICTQEVESGGSSSSSSSCGSSKVQKMCTSRRILLLALTFLAYTVDSVSAYGAPETLCGGELVDTLQFVCGDRGFYFSRPVGRNRGRLNRGIVEECCFRSCDLNLLETYCAKSVKSERDLSSSSLVALPALNKDPFQKPSHARYSKYDIWQKKGSQRLQRGIPNIHRARRYRWQTEGLQESEESKIHRPLIVLPTQKPLVVQTTTSETLGSQK
uniref:Insulin-like growth factor 2 n=1 Tax=Podarcis muralis TaxID=64176 RepID=A0A670I9C0_PODMU|nr:insulin-like growth factor II isoform X2 [Podarcis muralis]